MKRLQLLALCWCFQVTTIVNAYTIVNRGNGAEPDSLNIHLAQGLNSHNILLDMYEGLMTFSISGEPKYGVALTHTVNENSTEWHFTLNPEAKWSDGTSLTAHDFIRAWQTAAAPNTAAPYRQLFDNMTQQGKLQISSKQADHLSIKLNQADAGLLAKLVLPIFYPKPPKIIHADEQKVISNGAYFLHQWDIQERIILKKNPYFHAANQVQINEIHYWVTENQNTELLRFRAGDLDITETIPDTKISWLRKNLANELRIAPYYGTFFLGLNLQDKHLTDHKLRAALSLAIDRQILVDKVLKTGQFPATSIVPNLQHTATEKVNPSTVEINLQTAKTLLQQSGFNPISDRLEILYNNSDNQKKVALAVAAMWRQNLGVKSKLKNQEWKVFVQTRRGQQKQVFRSGWIADYHDPLNFLELFHSQSHFNFYNYANPIYDQLIEQMRGSYEPTQHSEFIAQAEHILQTDLPVIPLYHYVSRHLVQQHILGFVDNPMDRHLSRYLHLKLN